MFRWVSKLIKRYEYRTPLEGLNEMMKLLGSKSELTYTDLITRRTQTVAHFYCTYFHMEIKIVPKRKTYFKALGTNEIMERKHRFELVINVSRGALPINEANMIYIMNETKNRFKQSVEFEENTWYSNGGFHYGFELLSWKQLWEFMCLLAEVLREYN